MFFLGSSLNEETTVSRFYRFTRPCTAYSSPDPPHPTPPHVSLWIHSSELRRPYSPFPYYLSYSLDPRPISMCTAVYAYVRTYVLVDELWMKNIRLESRVASSWRGATGDRKFNYQMASKPIKYHGTYAFLSCSRIMSFVPAAAVGRIVRCSSQSVQQYMVLIVQDT